MNTKKSDKAPFIIYANLQCLIEKTAGCENTPEKWSKTKVFSMSTISSFKSIENKHAEVNIVLKSFVKL